MVKETIAKSRGDAETRVPATIGHHNLKEVQRHEALFHGAFSNDFHKNFVVAATKRFSTVCYVSRTSTLDGKPVRQVRGLGWRIV